MMRWKTKSIRQAAGFPPEGEMALCPFPGLGGRGLAGVATSGLGAVKAGSSASESLVHRLASLVDRPNDSHSTPHPATDDKFDSENLVAAQPSGQDGVPEDMATMVLDNSVLGAAVSRDGGQVGGGQEFANLDPAGDAAVMLRVAAGDEVGFSFLVQKYNRPILHFLFRMVHNQAVAEELTQEVFLRVYRSRESYRAEAKFSTWLYRIATNLAVNLARDTRHEREAKSIYLDAPDEESGTTPDVADDEPLIEERLLRDERMKAIRTHVMALPERQRMAVLMHKFQEMDYRQIGEVLKLSESATKSLLFRAYQTLRDKLKDFV
jgi:RNA polymerase sigma-70 factor (ECF subfamily)